MPNRLQLLALAAIVLAAAGCATIMNGRDANVALRSTPSEAQVTVRDHKGDVVAQTVTPAEVTLRRGRSWLRPAKYSATFEKEGYATAEAPLEAKLNPWMLGNIVLGGPFGLGVDLASGASWSPKSKEVERSLVRNDGGVPGATEAYAGNGPPEVRVASATEPIGDGP